MPETGEDAVLRSEMVERIAAWRAEQDESLSPAAEVALRTVPRHLFLPDQPLERAYAEDAIVTKRDDLGVAVSSVSAPMIVGLMLDQLRTWPGQRVLEIGSGGYNAALLRELVGPTGQVTTVDIDPDVVERARRTLAVAGYDDVDVQLGDAEFGVPGRAPFDRILVTVGAWDLPPAWVAQLTAGGRLVVPLRLRGLTRSVAFVKAADRLVSDDYRLCGFVPMQGVGARRLVQQPLHGDDVRLLLDDGQQVDADALRGVLAEPRVERWTGVTIGSRQPFPEHLDLWLATQVSEFCLLSASRAAIDSGLAVPSWSIGTPAITAGGSLAYRTWRRVPPDGPIAEPERAELGIYAHGPDADVLADRFAAYHQRWDPSWAPARIEVYPAGTPVESGYVLDKRHTRIAITWRETLRAIPA